MKSASTLMNRARNECARVAAGPFTPIVLENYGPLLTGERGVRMGRPVGACIVWAHQPATR